MSTKWLSIPYTQNVEVHYFTSKPVVKVFDTYAEAVVFFEAVQGEARLELVTRKLYHKKG